MNAARNAQRVDDAPATEAAIEAEIASAEADLRTALLGGQPTAPIRARLAELRAGAARLAAQHDEAEIRRAAEEATAIATAADAIANQAAGRVAARQPRPVPNPKDSVMQHPPAIAAAARQVAAATARASAAEARLAEAAAGEATARTRLDALAAQRAKVVSRRAGGDAHDDDGAVLALAAADAEGLRPLLAEAQAVATAARAEAAEATRRATVARADLAHVEAETEIVAVADHLQALDAAVVASLARLAELWTTLHQGGPQPYVPTPELAFGLRKLLAAAGRL